MGIITRHANAPFADGEILAGSDLEADFATVYDAVNGNLSSSNLADSAVTTAKIAATAVTQAKMTSGAASASEAQVAVGVTNAFSTAFATVGTPIVHTVGNPARHVIIMACLGVSMGAGVNASFRMLKDGASIYTTHNDDVLNVSGVTIHALFSRTYIDNFPTPGGTHTYTLQAKASTVAGIITDNEAIVAFEPRS